MSEYILYHDFKSVFKYFVKIRDHGWDEILSPVDATRFKTKMDAVNWSKKNTTFGEYAKAAVLKEEVADFLENLNLGLIRRSFKSLSKYSRPYDGESPEEILEWAVNKDEEIRYEDYKTWPTLYNVFEHIHEVEKCQDGSKSFSLSVNRNSDINTFKKELNLVLPYCSRFSDGSKKIKIFSVFDHYLCEGGNFVNFYYQNDNTCFIIDRFDNILGGQNIETVFEYWKRERYYE